MSGESIKIAVRVRPFNEKEKEQKQMLCIEMNETQTMVNDLIESKPQRKYTFDHSFWSYDGFTNDASGYSNADGTKYTDQKKVWECLGTRVLEKAKKGLNCTLFAYGQTGSGKSYSIFGYGANKGIVPMAGVELFKLISGNEDESVSYEIQIQMVEIYMERLQDLLVKQADRKEEPQVRQNKNGVYVQGAKKKAVSTYDEIQSTIDFGEKNRTIGATQMNATSSRSHTVITIQFTKKTNYGGKVAQTTSNINLVDLAGSEKSAQAGTTGKGLEEGNAINKSLTQLGNVIKQLAEIASGKAKKGAHVNYRDSVLTRMLQDALGGNSSTIMICAIRPGHLYYEETLNTLKYADRAKQIKNKPVINESDADRQIRMLKEENEKLKKQLASGGGGGGGDAMSAEALAEMEANKRQIEELSKSWEQKLAEQKAQEEKEQAEKAAEMEARNSGRPQLLNLNEDPMLDRKIFIDLSKKPSHLVGRKAREGEQPEIVLGGIGIQQKHATFHVDGNKVTLKPNDSAACKNVFVNGEALKNDKGVILTPNDRIIFGTGSVFLFRNQDCADKAKIQDTAESPIEFAFAMKEKEDAEDKANAAAKEEEKKRQEEETAAKMAELEAKMRAEAEEADKARKAMEEEYQKKLEEMKKMADAAADQEEQKRKEMEMKLAHEKAMEEQRLQAAREEREREERIKREEAAIKNKQAEFAALGEKLSKIHPLVNEANLIGKELGRNVRFNVKMETAMPEFSTTGERKTELKVKVDNKEEDYFYVWSCDKFEDRIAVMRDNLNTYFDTDTKPSYDTKDEDPFFDKPQPVLVGSSYLNLKSLCYTLENEVPNARIISSSGGSNDGSLNCAIWPCDAEGSGEPDEELLVEEPKELLGKEMYFRVEINKAQNLPADLCKNVFVTYQFKNEPNCIYSTEEHPDMDQSPEFNYKHVHHVDCISDYVLDYWEKGNIACKVFAYPQYTMVKGKKKIVQEQTVDEPAIVKSSTTINKSSDNKALPPTQSSTSTKTIQGEATVAKKSSCCTIF